MKRLSIALSFTLLLASSLAAQTRVGLSPERVVTGPFHRPTLASGEWKAPAFAAAGRDGHYLMAWAEYDDTTFTGSSLHVAAIDSTGAIVPGTRYVAPRLRELNPHAQYPAIAFDGERFLVAWIDGRGLSRLAAMRFDRDGRPIDAVPQQISLPAGLTYVAVAAGGGEFTIAYSRSGSAAVARIAADGTLLERDRTIPGTSGFWRDIESNGTAAFLVSDSSASTTLCIVGLCGSTGLRTFARIGSPADAITTVSSSGYSYVLPLGAGVATDGQRFLAVDWAQNTTATQSGSLIRGQLTDLDGGRFVREFLVAKHPDGSIEAKPGSRIDAVWTGGSYAIVYELSRGGKLDLYLTFASQIGMALIDPVVVADGDPQARTPIVLPVGESRVLVLYERGSYARPEIVARQATLSLKTRAVR
jgi:hypothetical protein